MIAELIGAAGNLLGGFFGRQSSEAAGDKNAALQREFAQSGIQWKVEDAKKAGVHPLYALGANTVSASPSYVGDTSLPTAMANAGQDISRAVDATRSPQARVTAYDQTMRDLQLTRMGLENELLASRIRVVNQAGHPPGVPALVPPPGPNTARGGDVGGQTLPMPLGFPALSTDRSATAEEIERQYGDVIQEGYGAGRLAGDVARGYAKKVISQSSWLPAFQYLWRQALPRIFEGRR